MGRKGRGKQFRKCGNCAKTYEVTRDWQIFCCEKCRVAFNKYKSSTCFYCGSYGSHKHHVEPCSARGARFLEGVEYVYSCSECNGMMSDYRFKNIADACDFLIERITKKYSLSRPAVEWDDDELQELGRGLRARIKKKLSIRHLAEARVFWLKNTRNTYLSDISGEECNEDEECT